MQTVKNPTLTDLLPDSASDDKIRALCAALDMQLTKLAADSAVVLHLPRLDDLHGKILDALAEQFHLDFYENFFDDEQKKRLIRESIAWHRIKGTPAAVEKVSADLGQRCDLTEWWQDGDPHGWFRINTDYFSSPEVWSNWLRAIFIAKNVRSWCAIRFQDKKNIDIHVAPVVFCHGTIKVGYATQSESARITYTSGTAAALFGTIKVQPSN